MKYWTDGNMPNEKTAYYWLTVKSATNNITYPVPCRYSETDDCWIDFNNVRLSKHTVVAYSEIVKPKDYTTVGSGFGYYIRTMYRDKQSIYGYGLQPANWCGRGYSSKEKAVAAAKRLIRLDKNEEYVRDTYEVINGNSEVVWKWK